MRQQLTLFLRACFNVKEASHSETQLPYVGGAYGAGLGALAGIARELFRDKGEKRHYLRSGLIGAGLGGGVGMLSGSALGMRGMNQKGQHFSQLLNRAQTETKRLAAETKNLLIDRDLFSQADAFYAGKLSEESREYALPKILDSIEKYKRQIKFYNDRIKDWDIKTEDIPDIARHTPKISGVFGAMANDMGGTGVGALLGAGVGAVGGASHAALSDKKKRRWLHDILTGAAAGGLGGAAIGSLRDVNSTSNRLDLLGDQLNDGMKQHATASQLFQDATLRSDAARSGRDAQKTLLLDFRDRLRKAQAEALRLRVLSKDFYARADLGSRGVSPFLKKTAE